MKKENIKFNIIKKKMIAVFTGVVVLTSCASIGVSAADNRYTFSTDYMGSGATVSRNANKKEYTKLSVNCESSSATAILSLWKSAWLQNVHYGQDQAVRVGTNRRVWWYGDTDNSANYYISAHVADNFGHTVSFDGFFQNFT